MALVSKIIWLLLPISIFFGQLFRINIFNINFPAIYILIVFFALLNIITAQKNKQKISNFYLLFFIFILIFTYLINLFNFTFKLNSFLLLTRLISLLSFLIYKPKIIKDHIFQKIFTLSIFTNIIFGLIQYFIWPNFTYFSIHNWDPHLYRLVSTYYDPTFTALIFLLFMANIYFQKINIKFKIAILTISYIAFALTYSRASFISFFILFSYIALINKNLKLFIFISFISISTIFILPRQEGEGTKLERTSSIKAKIDNYQEAFTLYKQNPILGIGYNNISQARLVKNPQSHANNSFDGSLMNILITTGPIGLLLFIFGLKYIFFKSNLLTQSSLISILFHSLFTNSLFYSFVLLVFIFFIQDNAKSRPVKGDTA